MSKDDADKKATLLKIIQEVTKKDTELREQFHIGDKFRFIRDRLQALAARIEENLAAMKVAREKDIVTLGEDESYVYVYLFNAQGLQLHTWLKMLSPSVFYEYSVNRPIYQEKKFVEAVIRNKPNKVQHAYLTIAVKKSDIIVGSGAATKDLQGNPLIKVREGSLLPGKLLAFTYNNSDYLLTADNQLEKKK